MIDLLNHLQPFALIVAGIYLGWLLAPTDRPTPEREWSGLWVVEGEASELVNVYREHQ